MILKKEISLPIKYCCGEVMEQYLNTDVLECIKCGKVRHKDGHSNIKKRKEGVPVIPRRERMMIDIETRKKIVISYKKLKELNKYKIAQVVADRYGTARNYVYSIWAEYKKGRIEL